MDPGLQYGETSFTQQLFRGYMYSILRFPLPPFSLDHIQCLESMESDVPTDSVSQSGYVYLADAGGGIVILEEQDIQPPDVYITNPTFSPLYTNATSSLSLGGGSDDNVGVMSITWWNNRGGGGQVSAPFDSWYVTGIKLLPGSNILTIAAFDAAGNSGTDTLTVIYQTTNQNQTITFPAIADHAFGDPPIQLVAAASSGLPVVLSVVSGPAVLSGSNVLTLTGAGTVTVEGDQPGSESFNPATAVDVSFNVAMADQSIAFTPIPAKSAGDASFVLTATTSSGLPVYFGVLFWTGDAQQQSGHFGRIGYGNGGCLAAGQLELQCCRNRAAKFQCQHNPANDYVWGIESAKSRRCAILTKCDGKFWVVGELFIVGACGVEREHRHFDWMGNGHSKRITVGEQHVFGGVNCDSILLRSPAGQHDCQSATAGQRPFPNGLLRYREQ